MSDTRARASGGTEPGASTVSDTFAHGRRGQGRRRDEQKCQTPRHEQAVVRSPGRRRCLTLLFTGAMAVAGGVTSKSVKHPGVGKR